MLSQHNTFQTKQNKENQKQKLQEQVQEMEQQYDQNFQSLEMSKKSPQPPSKFNNFNQGKNNFSKQKSQSKQQENKFPLQNQEVIIQNQEASQTLIGLSNKHFVNQQAQKEQVNENNQNHDQNEFQRHLQEQRQKNIKELQDEISKKKQIIENLKKKVAQKRTQIKQIGQEVDKDIQKNMFRIGKKKSATVNIKEIFAQTKKSKNQKTSQLNEQLKIVRQNIRSIKQEIHLLEIKFTDPINQDNIQKCQTNQVKIKLSQIQIQKIKDEAKMLNQQVLRMKNIFSAQQEAEIQKNTQQNCKKINLLINQFKEQKQKQYKFQKDDILLSEKLKFVSQNENDYQEMRKEKKKRIQSQIKNKNAEIQIKELIKEINSIMEERNKIENQKRSQIKTLMTEIQSMQGDNLDLINKLRDIDAFLLHYYSYKTKKNSFKVNQKAKTAQKLHETIDNGSPLLPTKDQKINDQIISSSNSKFKLNQSHQVKTYKKSQTTEVATQTFNDKNMSFVQQNKVKPSKKTHSTYEFGQLKKSNDCSVLSDALLNKVILKDIFLYADEQHLYGIQGEYFDQNKKQVKGSKIVGKQRQQSVKKLHLNLKNNEQLKQITVKIGKNKEIIMFKILTTLNNQLKWQSKLNLVSKDQQKTMEISRYSEIYIKGMLTKLQQPLVFGKKIQQNQSQKLILKGVGFYAVSE